MPPRILLIVTALVEAPTGLCLLAVPQLPFAFLFGSTQPAPEALLVGRIAGAALFAIGVASWLARRDSHSQAQLGLLTGMLIYNTTVAAILVLSATVSKFVGPGLWPGVLLHTALGIWCLAALNEARLKKGPGREADGTRELSE
jgi:hypothetical protein